MMNNIRTIKAVKAAGPELDLEVHTRVLGGSLPTDEACQIMSYSSYIGHAFDLVEHLSGRWAFSMVCAGKENIVIFKERLASGKPRQAMAAGTTASLAICLAALQVKALESRIITA